MALGLPVILAWKESGRTALDLDGGRAEKRTKPESAQFLLVVARRNERFGIDDPIPHRNSRVVLYRRAEKGGWLRETDSLPIRSLATARYPKRSEANNSVIANTRYGFVGVPLGVFTLKKGVWRDGETPAFLISDWGRWDGTIRLKEAQVIRLPRQIDEQGNVQSSQVIRSSLKKSGCWIHATRTKTWSHGDSDGCMNLLRDRASSLEKQDYDKFLSWFDKRGLSPGPQGNLIPLAVVPFEMAEGEAGLKESLAEGFLKRARQHQGRQLEDLT